jgi:hypothetical protein
MDWLLLLLLTALIVVAFVSLVGFAGCSFTHGTLPQPTAPPSDLDATATGADRIDLIWMNNSVVGSHFSIRRSVGMGGTFTEIAQVPIATTTYRDQSGLSEGTYYEYQIFTLNGAAESQGSNIDGDTTLVWRPSFDRGPTVTIGVDGPDLSGECLVQRIPASLLALGGSAVRITIRSSIAGDLRLQAAHISQPAPAGDPWDSANDLVPVLFAGSPTVLVKGSNPSERSDETAYALDETKDLIVALDIGTPGNGRRTSVTGARAFRRVNTSPPQGGLQDRLSDFTPLPADTVIVIEKIEVLTRA